MIFWNYYILSSCRSVNILVPEVYDIINKEHFYRQTVYQSRRIYWDFELLATNIGALHESLPTKNCKKNKRKTSPPNIWATNQQSTVSIFSIWLLPATACYFGFCYETAPDSRCYVSTVQIWLGSRLVSLTNSPSA
jgi:hypothetical protein